jgi:hypothetical protein
VSAAVAPELDAWIAEPAIRIQHRREARAPAKALWEAAGTVRLEDTRMLGRVVRWRIPGLRSGLTFRELFREDPFTLLDEGEAHSVSGLGGRIWTTQRDYPHLDGAKDFRSFDAPGTVRVLFAHWVEPTGAGASVLCSEARVEPVDGAGARRMRATWRVVGVFERLIGSEPLSIAVCRAEARA